MESNIKGLVSAGHEMASELKAECGAVDMRSVAKLISDLATQLEVQLVRANALAEDHQRAIESIKQADSAVKLAHEKFSALAAENAGLNKFIKDDCWIWDDKSEEYFDAADCMPETPATDASLAEVRAQRDALAAENVALRSKAAELAHEASKIYSAYNATITEPDGDFMDMQTLHEMQCIETPATDAFLAEIRAAARNEGINYTASRLAAAFNHGFINKSLREVFDVTRMILSAKEELANEPHPIDGLSGEYAEKSLGEWAEQISKGGSQ